MKIVSAASLVWTFVLLSCSTVIKNSAVPGDPNATHIASLDNNGDIEDRSFDKNLETYYRGSAEAELDAINAATGLVKKFIESQKQVRKEMMSSPGEENTPDAQRVFKDLPTPAYATRDVHRKANGCFKAKLNFTNDLTEVSQEVFM